MKTITMRLEELKAPAKNTRKHPQKQIAEMKRSLDMFGQFRPIVVDETNTILAGNGMVQAMRESGMTEASVLKYENLTEAQKKKLMLADNQIASLGVDDYGAIEEVIRELKDELDIPGYDDDTLQMIVQESEYAVKQALSYGTYESEETQRLKDVEQEREEKGFEPVAQPATYQNPVNPPDPREVEVGTYETAVDLRKFVVCPHCGEKIYI